MRREGMHVVLSGGTRVVLKRRLEMKYNKPSQEG